MVPCIPCNILGMSCFLCPLFHRVGLSSSFTSQIGHISSKWKWIPSNHLTLIAFYLLILAYVLTDVEDRVQTQGRSMKRAVLFYERLYLIREFKTDGSRHWNIITTITKLHSKHQRNDYIDAYVSYVAVWPGHKEICETWYMWFSLTMKIFGLLQIASSSVFLVSQLVKCNEVRMVLFILLFVFLTHNRQTPL